MLILSCFFIFQITSILSYSHQKPLHQKLWSERCTRNSIALNDCNWCWCDVRHRYQCKARVCEEIDMFGHFKDAIRDINVGMEGHGSWRSTITPCSPGVHYRRGDVLCLCDEDGYWPNPVCRDLFRVLHTVQVQQDAVNQTCTPNNLYVIGCNVCFCSSSGYLNREMCTKKECPEDDPALPENRPKDQSSSEEPSEVYAKCDAEESYDLGCRTCSCLKNNRLICNNCVENQLSKTINPTLRKKTKGVKKKKKKIKNTRYGICEGKYPKEQFNMGCSSCYCDKYSVLFCSIRNCIKPIRGYNPNLKRSQIDSNIVPPEIKDVEAPIFDELCTPGTRYKRGCNICICLKLDQDSIVFDCSLERCAGETSVQRQQRDCVVGTAYTKDCQVCYCYTIDGIKHQICQVNDECEQETNELENGYCLPLKSYKRDCNICKCLSDGKTLACSSKNCANESLKPVSIDLVPVQMINGDVCPKGYSYQLDCNLCFCLSNGNAICTTINCSNNYKD